MLNVDCGSQQSVGVLVLFPVLLVSLCVVNLHFHKLKLFFQTADLSLRFVLVKSLFGDQLSSEVLNLQGVFLFDCFVLFTHDVPPDYVELVEDLRNASLSHLWVESLLDLFDLLNCFRWNPLVCIPIFLSCSSSLSLVWLDAKSVANASNTLLRKILGLFHDVDWLEVLVLRSLLEQLDQFFVITLHIVQLHVNWAFTFSGTIEVLHWLFKLCYLCP